MKEKEYLMIDDNYKVGLPQIVRKIRVKEPHCAEFCTAVYLEKSTHLSGGSTPSVCSYQIIESSM
jgi:hypothetical protein